MSTEFVTRVAADGHIYLHSQETGRAFRLTWNEGVLSYGVWNTEDSFDRIRYYWPTWSPDGKKLACIGTYGPGGEEHGTGLYVLDIEGGVESWELWASDNWAPVYVSWTPDASRLGLVLQKHEALGLLLTSLDQPGETLDIVTGLPLFHRFSPDGQSLAIHVGGRFNGEPGRRLYQVDLDSPDRRLTLSDRLGPLGTPAWSGNGDALVFPVQDGDKHSISLSPYGRGPVRALGSLDGFGTLLWDKDENSILVAATSDADEPVYESLWRLPLDDSPPVKLLQERFLAFFPSSEGRIIFVAAPNGSNALLWKVRESDGSVRSVAKFYPSHPQKFMLRFFHQYRLTHPPVSPDGSKILFSGYETLKEQNNSRILPRVYIANIHEQKRLEAMSEGAMACWAPSNLPERVKRKLETR